LAQGPQAGEGDVEQQDIGGGRHAETGRAEAQSNGHQHGLGTVAVGQPAHDGHQNSAHTRAGHIQNRDAGAGESGVFDDGIDEYREYVGLAGAAAKDHQTRRAYDEPTVKDTAAGHGWVFRWGGYLLVLRSPFVRGNA